MDRTNTVVTPSENLSFNSMAIEEELRNLTMSVDSTVYTRPSEYLRQGRISATRLPKGEKRFEPTNLDNRLPEQSDVDGMSDVSSISMAIAAPYRDQQQRQVQSSDAAVSIISMDEEGNDRQRNPEEVAQKLHLAQSDPEPEDMDEVDDLKPQKPKTPLGQHVETEKQEADVERIMSNESSFPYIPSLVNQLEAEYKPYPNQNIPAEKREMYGSDGEFHVRGTSRGLRTSHSKAWSNEGLHGTHPHRPNTNTLTTGYSGMSDEIDSVIEVSGVQKKGSRTSQGSMFQRFLSSLRNLSCTQSDVPNNDSNRSMSHRNTVLK